LYRNDIGVLSSSLYVYTRTRGRIGILKEDEDIENNVNVSVELGNVQRGQAIYPNKIVHMNQFKGNLRRFLGYRVWPYRPDECGSNVSLKKRPIKTYLWKHINMFRQSVSECWCAFLQEMSTMHQSHHEELKESRQRGVDMALVLIARELLGAVSDAVGNDTRDSGTSLSCSTF
jgi:hypothetical protein